MLKPLDILHVIGSVDPATGGPVEGIMRQEAVTGGAGGKAIREIVTLDVSGAPFLTKYNIKVHALGRRNIVGGFATRAFGHLLVSAAYVRWLKSNISRFDVVIVHGLWNYSTLAASRVLRKSNTPYFVFSHGMMDPWFKRRYPIKNVFKKISWLISEGPLLSGAKAVLFTSEEERLLAQGQFPLYRYNPIVVEYGTDGPPPNIGCNVAMNRFVRDLVGDDPFILFLGRLHEKKGPDILIDAFAQMSGRLPFLQLIFAGPASNEYRAALEKKTLDAGVGGSRVRFVGPLYGDAKWAMLDAAEAFVLPSHQENFGIAVAEALACGTPVLITDKVNIWREVIAGGAGLVSTDTVEGIVELLNRWMDLSVDERQAMKSAAQGLFESTYNVRNTAPALIARMREYLDTD